MSLADEWDQIGKNGPKRPKKKPAAPVDTVRLKKDIEEDKAWPMHFVAGTGETLQRMRSSVVRSDSLKNARAGKIPVASPKKEKP